MLNTLIRNQYHGSPCMVIVIIKIYILISRLLSDKPLSQQIMLHLIYLLIVQQVEYCPTNHVALNLYVKPLSLNYSNIQKNES